MMKLDFVGPGDGRARKLEDLPQIAKQNLGESETISET
jgi:hypothetical protein